jgi:BTB/POZ domain
MLNRSPVFRAMLTAGMKEQASGRIELKNMKLKTGQDLLYYLYNQRMKPDSDLTGLLAAADQYDMPELKAECGEALAAGGGVTRDNYVELMHMAELYNVKVLKEAVFDYIAANRGGLIS